MGGGIRPVLEGDRGSIEEADDGRIQATTACGKGPEEPLLVHPHHVGTIPPRDCVDPRGLYLRGQMASPDWKRQPSCGVWPHHVRIPDDDKVEVGDQRVIPTVVHNRG